MGQTKHTADTGVRIENTLSVSLQKRRLKRNPIYMLLITAAGVFGSIASFLSMFHPACNVSILVGAMVIFLGFMSFIALTPRRYGFIKLTLYGVLLVLIYIFRNTLFCGFAYLMNDVYGCIQETDRMYFQIESELSHEMGCTIFLIFASALITLLVSFAVLRYHNFFLSFLATFPYVELGLFFGYVPNHFFASLTVAFWCSMAAIHAADFGSYRTKEKSGFLRKKNTFFPVSSMQFMVTEHVGIQVMATVFLLMHGIWAAVQLSGYERSEKVKQMRADFIYYCENFSFESSVLDKMDIMHMDMQNDSVIQLGNADKQEFENVPVASVSMSGMPTGRVYLKCYTGSVYRQNQWGQLPPAASRIPLFDAFSKLDFYPQDFLYASLENSGFDTEITLTYSGSSDILDDCVPYGIVRQGGMGCNKDDRYTGLTQQYTLFQYTDYEQLLSDLDTERRSRDLLLSRVPADAKEVLWELASTDAPSGLVWCFTPNTERKAEASSLCLLGYSDFVREQYCRIPDTDSMQQLRENYADLLDRFDSASASPRETISFLKKLRNRMCSEVTYSLEPGKTPAGTDFVNYFLLDNKKGYCVHYATAGAVLARMAGIPARYCEGYLLDPEQEVKNAGDAEGLYTADILDSNAHAWAEVYIEGMGWIPFEFTYTYFDTPATPSIPMPEPTMPATQAPTAASTAATPPSPTEASTNMGTTPPASPDAPNTEISRSAHPTTTLLILTATLLAASFLAGVVLMRRRALIKRRSAFRQPDRQKAAAAVCAYLKRMMVHCGTQRDACPISELAESAAEKCQPFMKKHDITTAVSIMAKLRYSTDPISDEELAYLRAAAGELAFGIYRKAPILKRIWIQWGLHFV